MIPLREQQAIRQRFNVEVTSRVRIDFFTQKETSFFVAGREPCAFCDEIKLLLEETASLSPRISLTVHDFDAERNLARELGIERVPGTIIRGQTNRPIRYFGLMTGLIFPGFIETIIDASQGKVELETDTVRQLRKVKEEVQLQVLMATGEQFSPPHVRSAVKFGLQNNKIKVEIIEIAEFQSLMQRYNVRSVPTTVLNERFAFSGSMSETTLAQLVLQTAEGRPFSGQTYTGPSTALTPPQQQPAQRELPRSAGGIILPG
jgi:glutaredoxin-like protein